MAAAFDAFSSLGEVLVLLAHDTGIPHADPAPQQSSGGGGNTVAIVIGLVGTLAALSALVWLRERQRASDDGEPPEG